MRGSVAAPVGHIFGALLLMQSNVGKIVEPTAFLAGTSFPDIRYISPIDRKVTHHIEDKTLANVWKANGSFEQGRRFHSWLDYEREKYMRANNAYRFVKNKPLAPTHMLKIVEDHLLFSKLKGQFDPEPVFDRIYPEERAFGVPDKDIKNWHNILKAYLGQKHWFTITRYYASLLEFRHVLGKPKSFLGELWDGFRSLGFLIYAYVQVEYLSQNPELQRIILDFYEVRLRELVGGPMKDKESTSERISSLEKESRPPARMKDLTMLAKDFY